MNREKGAAHFAAVIAYQINLQRAKINVSITRLKMPHNHNFHEENIPIFIQSKSSSKGQSTSMYNNSTHATLIIIDQLHGAHCHSYKTQLAREKIVNQIFVALTVIVQGPCILQIKFLCFLMPS